jgi:hypothetical protein
MAFHHVQAQSLGVLDHDRHRAPADAAALQVRTDEDAVLATVVVRIGMRSTAPRISPLRGAIAANAIERVVQLGRVCDEFVAEVLDRLEEMQAQILVVAAACRPSVLRRGDVILSIESVVFTDHRDVVPAIRIVRVTEQGCLDFRRCRRGVLGQSEFTEHQGQDAGVRHVQRLGAGATGHRTKAALATSCIRRRQLKLDTPLDTLCGCPGRKN